MRIVSALLPLLAVPVLASCDAQTADEPIVCPAVVRSVTVEVRTSDGTPVGDAMLDVREAASGKTLTCAAEAASGCVKTVAYVSPPDQPLYALQFEPARLFGQRAGTKTLLVEARRGTSSGSANLSLAWDVCGADGFARVELSP